MTLKYCCIYCFNDIKSSYIHIKYGEYFHPICFIKLLFKKLKNLEFVLQRSKI